MLKKQKVFALMLIFAAFLAVFYAGTAYAKDETDAKKYKDVKFYLRNEEITLYAGDRNTLAMAELVDSSMLDQDTNIKLAELLNSDEFRMSKVFTTSDVNVVSFTQYSGVSMTHLAEVTDYEGVPVLVAEGPGTATVTIKYPTLNKSIKCKITVLGAGLFCKDVKFYVNNSYTFELKGEGITPVSFKSSDKSIAKVSKKGKVTALKKGKVTISCKASDGKTYKKKIKIVNSGINQSKIVIYASEGQSDLASNYPLVVYGENVKKWKTSDKKVAIVEAVKIDDHVSIGFVKYRGKGTCTITATTTDGKKLKCKVKAVTWGINTPGTSSYIGSETLKKSYKKFFDSIYKKQDYGNVIIMSGLTSNVDIGNGNKPVDISGNKVNELAAELSGRYPDEMTYMNFCSTASIKVKGKTVVDGLDTIVVYVKENGLY